MSELEIVTDAPPTGQTAGSKLLRIGQWLVFVSVTILVLISAISILTHEP